MPKIGAWRKAFLRHQRLGRDILRQVLGRRTDCVAMPRTRIFGRN
jgi:hypothetical protein